MSSSHTSWQGAADRSNKIEQKRVAKKYNGVKKISEGHFSDKDMDVSTTHDSDPLLDDMGIGQTHDAKQYSRAAALPLNKATKLLKETDTLRK
jgi:hypothetical protein